MPRSTDPSSTTDSAPWRDLYPFRSHWLPIGDHRLHYVDEGSGAPVLLVHGNPTWSFYWRNIMVGLGDRYRMIAVDHLGCGLSDKPQAYDYNLVNHTANLTRLVDELDLHDATLVVHDWGGAIGLGTLVERPDRFRRIVVFNTGAFPPPFCPWRIRVCRWPWIGPWSVRRLNVFARAALTMAVERSDRMTPAVRAGFLAPYDSFDHRIAIARFVQDIPLSKRHPTWSVLERLEQRLHDLPRRPVQIIWGMRDWCFTPQCLERMCRLFPHADVVRMEDAGHYVVEDAHERIVPLMARFLEDDKGQTSRGAAGGERDGIA